MKLSFKSNEVDRCRKKVQDAEAAYREALQANKKFSELKKIYTELKQSEKELQSVLEGDKPSHTRISYNGVNDV